MAAGSWTAVGMRHNVFFFLVDVISYSSAIVACEKGRKWKHAFGLLVWMQQHTLLSAVISYNSSINACEKGG